MHSLAIISCSTVCCFSRRSGPRLTFTDSGHSDQQPTESIGEEDGLDERTFSVSVVIPSYPLSTNIPSNRII
jgi:hypothetical protein